MNDYSIELKGHTLEYFDDEHLYLVDGVIVPSITEILKVKFGGKYDGISRATLQMAADKGTEVHDAIEHLVKTGEVTDLPEVRNFLFLKNQYGFDVYDCEVPLILFDDDEPICAGRCDLVLYEHDGVDFGGADIKRTSALDKLYLTYQLNLYRIAYLQSYGTEWKFLRGIHLRENVRRYVFIPINERCVTEILEEWRSHE